MKNKKILLSSLLCITLFAANPNLVANATSVSPRNTFRYGDDTSDELVLPEVKKQHTDNDDIFWQHEFREDYKSLYPKPGDTKTYPQEESFLEPGSSENIKYVSLGDSYASGVGTGQYSGHPACGRSVNNYAHQLAAKFNLKLTDASCVGAVSDNIKSKPQYLDKNTYANPQIESVTPDTKIVTISIGGNDIHFANIAKTCVANTVTGGLLTHPFTSNCSDILDKGASRDVYATIDAAIYDILRTYDLVKTKAPEAKVIVVGYPSIAPNNDNFPEGGCFRSLLDRWRVSENAFPFKYNDLQFIHKVEEYLNESLKHAAEQNGFQYLSQLKSTEAYTACVADHNKRLMNPIMRSSLYTRLVSSKSLHPNLAGQTETANKLTHIFDDIITGKKPGTEKPVAAPGG